MVKTTDSDAEQGYRDLRELLASFPGIAVAFSGGVDSTLLLEVASEVLGEKVVAITARSDLFPQSESADAAAFCEWRGIRLATFDFDEMAVCGFASNPADRCYHCKTALLSQAWTIARSLGFEILADGSNVDDERDYRPGRRAVIEQGLRSPLLESGLTKDAIRVLSHKLGLVTWNKPALACLASRIPYGDSITPEILKTIDQAESYLQSLGFTQVRVRVHRSIARVELLPSEFAYLLEDDHAARIDRHLKELGFSFVTIDLAGYRTGSLNEGLIPS